MEYKADLERAIVADLVKPSASKRYRTAIYTLTALCSVVALGMTLLYHWNEIQLIDRRLKAQDVQEVIRLTDVLLAKHETNAANVEKFLTLFEHKLQSIESKLQPKTDANDFERNLTHGEAKDNTPNRQGNKRVEMLGSTVSPSETKMRESNTVEAVAVTSIDAQSNGSDSAETTQPEAGQQDENQTSEIFRWGLSFPQAAWVKLSTFGIDYGTASDNVVVSEEQE